MPKNFDLLTARVGVRVLVDDAPLTPAAPVMWPSMGEYPVYDAGQYRVLTSDENRNARFRAALRHLAGNRTVLDIGTGADVLWARESIAAGARHAIAMEVMDDTCAAASELIAESGLENSITLLKGTSTELTVEPKADVCVAEVIGSVAGAEGAAVVLGDARRRLLNPGGRVVPHRCVTRAAAVSLSAVLGGREPAFGPGAIPLLERIFDWNGAPFDVRLRIRDPDRSAVISTDEPVEVLDFNGDLSSEQEQQVTLTVERPGRVDGVLTWMQMSCLPDEVPLDALRDDTSWASVYFPLFPREVAVEPGDRLQLGFRTTLSDDGLHPDYHLSATLHAGGAALSARFSSLHHGDVLHSHPVYRKLLLPL
ncbi:class I SAM-dependent methyltransferase [Kitasatospora sp. RB6PN24]|uniref:class I SAM-dependent methyltransferase n=1 Tax=Kitasatospora humi TaxID=2893891 RepID=UPI001E4C1AF4|nr:class I SAM-dependent methyltransferase [Kitasatospora humi]MCC9306034.1 class I SAM-dependent methyltransferase [Kitasatospora humi]